MRNALPIILGRLGKQSDPCVVTGARRGGSTRSARTKRVANLPLLLGTALITALFACSLASISGSTSRNE